MGEPPSDGSVPAGTAPPERLDSWKEIAAYLKRDVTTVQRWEKREGMPVRRHLHDKLGSVYAFKSELDSWSRSRHPPHPNEPNPPATDRDGRERSNDAGPRDGDERAASDSGGARRRRRSPIVVTVGLTAVLTAGWWFAVRSPAFWRDPLVGAQFRSLTDFDGVEQAAAISRDGRLVAFLSDRDGPMDVWITQVGAGQFYNLTRGRVPELVNPSIRPLSFSPDGALLTFWARGGEGAAGEINIWAVPTLGGQPRPYLEGAAEFDWSRDGSRIAYHTPGPGDPMFVAAALQERSGAPVFSAPTGMHAHFPLWSRDGRFIYFVQGTLPDAMDIWRVQPSGGDAERITTHEARVSYPVWLNDREMMYLATDGDGSGPWMYNVDVERRISRRVGTGVDRYTSLAASADGRRLVATLASPKGTLWRLPIAGEAVAALPAAPISLTTGRGFSPRLGPGFLLYVSSTSAGDSVWKLADGVSTELWRGPGSRVVGGPEIARDGRRVAFSTEQRGKKRLYAMNADGTDQQLVTEALDLQGAPSWTPDGQAITSAVNVDGKPLLFHVSLDGKALPLVHEYSVDPAWSPRGDFIVYSGADVGTMFPVKAVTTTAAPYHNIPSLTLTRGARRLRFFPGRHQLVAMMGNIQHKDLWLIDLDTGERRPLTTLPADFDLRDFDVAPDGREIVVERVQEHSDVVLIDVDR